MFYHYRQNNSGGYWRGPVNVVVEADTTREADEIAEDNGIYFNGVRDGRDCGCCGNRWSPAWPDDGEDVPHTYSRPIDLDGELDAQPTDTHYYVKVVYRDRVAYYPDPE